ncbi:MAG: hypothetical protein U1G07_25095 [Verrucomicrobiota bacterium]
MMGLVLVIPLLLTLLAVWRWRPAAPILAVILLLGGLGLAGKLVVLK